MPNEVARWRWIGPIAALLVFAGVAYVLHRQLANLQVRDILGQFRSIGRADILTALAFTAASYLLLGCYDLLALRYLGKRLAYARVAFTSFIASAFGYNLGAATLTGAAVRLRLYAAAGLTAVDVAAISAFGTVSIALGLFVIAGVSFVTAPERAATALHVHGPFAGVVGVALLAVVAGYLLWCLFARRPLEFRGWALRAPHPGIAFVQTAISIADMALAAAVLWWLLPEAADVDFHTFAGAFVVAVAAGALSHVPGGLGVFETVMILMMPHVPASSLLGSMLAYRAIYYLAPLCTAAVLFAIEELRERIGPLARAHQLASLYVAPVVPQVAGTLTFFAGVLLLISGATPSVDARLATLWSVLPLAVLELSHLIGSIIGLALLVLSRALFRRVRAAYHISFWLLIAGIVASLLKGLELEAAFLLAVVLWVLLLGQRAFYRPTSIFDERFTPAWTVSIAGVIVAVFWILLIAYRHVDYSHQLWWTFALDSNAPRALRAMVAVVVLAGAWFLLTLLQPARPEPAAVRPDELERARTIIARSELTLANAALSGDKRLLFNDAGDAFLMYQVTGRSWIALGDPVGPRERAEELVWRFRELSDRHGGRVVFYQASGDRLPLYVDLGLAALKIGEEARVSLDHFSLEGSARAELRQAHHRARRDGASFEVIPPERVPQVLPDLARVSALWLSGKSTAEKGFSVGSFSERYLRYFPVAVVRSEGTPSAFANLWQTGTKEELSVDLMRFAPDAPRGAMDYLFIELMQWGRAQGYRWFNLGMAPLSGLDRHPLAPAWHRVGNFVFRHGEHFYNFEGLRRYKAKFDPTWEPKYLVAPAGVALPRILVDVSVLIAGGVKELVTR